MPPTVFAGSRSRFFIDNKLIGYAAGVSGSETVEHEPVDVLDLLEVKEFVPVAYRCTLSAQIFRVIGNSLKAQGIFPVLGNILRTNDMVATLEDTITGNIMAQFSGVRCSEHSWDVTARGITSENTTFTCIRIEDEYELPAGG